MKVNPLGELRKTTTLLSRKAKSVRPDPRASAIAAGLHYTTDSRPGIKRVRQGGSFRYVSPEGRTIRNADELRRIRALVIPPAWKDVWISADPRGHLQAVRPGARGRQKYRHPPQWRRRFGQKQEKPPLRGAPGAPAPPAPTNPRLPHTP